MFQYKTNILEVMKFEEMSEKGFDKFSSLVCQTESKSLGKVGLHSKQRHNGFKFIIKSIFNCENPLYFHRAFLFFHLFEFFVEFRRIKVKFIYFAKATNLTKSPKLFWRYCIASKKVWRFLRPSQNILSLRKISHEIRRF